MKSSNHNKIYEIAFWVIFAAMAVYYGVRMFTLTPWYDELYTYYCFISKGPVYSAIHWPLPNNHVGYSVLSGFLDILGNSYIGLRGVSYLCALANMYLIYKIAGKFLDSIMPLISVVLYVSMNLVNQMAVQGRGYTLGTACLLLAFLAMIRICSEDKVKKLTYIVYTLALTLGLYAVTSNVYWVVPLCLAGGLYLLLKKDGKRLVKLVIASLVAALLTVFLYMTIWMSIGSNLLVKETSSIYYGMGHVKMITSAPFAAIGRGMEYMLDTPYIQSEARAGFLGRLGSFFVSLSGYYYNSIAVVAIWVVGLIYLAIKAVRTMKSESKQNLLLYFFLIVEILFIPICLLLQCKRPYYRVFTYGGALLALLIAVLVDALLKMILQKVGREEITQKLYGFALVITAVFFVKCMFFSGYNAEYGEREHEIEEALSYATIVPDGNYCVTDCNQEYLLHFLYGIRCENTEIMGTDMVLLDKRMTEPDFNEMIWEFYHYYNTIPWDYIEDNMMIAYESENYILYQRSEKESK